MNSDLILVMALLCVCVFFFAINRPRVDVIALMSILILPLCGLVSFDEALSGFSNSSVILIALMFVVGEGLVRTGISFAVGDWILSKAGESQTKLLVLLMASVIIIGAVMSSTGIVALFIPIALGICAKQKISPAKLMMPLSFAGLISGMMTLVATPPNMIMNAELVRMGKEGFGFFAFTPIGLIVSFAGIFYMLYARRFLGNDKNDEAQFNNRRTSLSAYVKEYALADRQSVFLVPEGSAAVGKTLAEISMHAKYLATAITIERGRGMSRKLIEPIASTQVRAHDVLLVNTRDIAKTSEMEGDFGLEKVPFSKIHLAGSEMEIGMVEVMITPDSELIGKTVMEAQFRSHYRTNIIGLRRDRKPLEGDLIDERFKGGDVLLVIGSWKSIKNLQEFSGDFVLLNLPAEVDRAIAAPGRAPHALFSLFAMVFLMISGLVPNAMAALIGCMLMLAFRCIDMESAYKSVSWPSVILIVGMMPFAIALEKTGGVETAAKVILEIFGNGSPRLVLAAVMAVTMIAGIFISNTVTAVLVAPIALTAANLLDVSVYPFAMAVALGASTAFMTPISSPVNTLVFTPGRYKFFDFVKIGVPFSIIVLIIGVIFIPIFFPFEV